MFLKKITFLLFFIFIKISAASAEQHPLAPLHLGQDSEVRSVGIQIILGPNDDTIYPSLLWHYRMGCRNFEIVHQGLTPSQQKKIEMFYDRVIDNCSLNAISSASLSNTNDTAALLSASTLRSPWTLQLTDRQILCLHEPLQKTLEAHQTATLSLPSCLYQGFDPAAPVSFWPQTDERLIYRSNITFEQPVRFYNSAASGEELSTAAHIATFSTMDEAVRFSSGMVRDQLPFMDVMTSSIRYACHGDRSAFDWINLKGWVKGWVKPSIATNKEKALDSFAQKYGFNPNVLFGDKTTYVAIEKCGWSTVSRAMSSHEINRVFHSPGYREFYRAPIAILDRYQRLLDEKIFTFTCVRNPYSRALSMYQDKMFGTDKVLFRPYFGFSLEEDVSFQEFLEAIKERNPKDLDSHFRTSTSLTFFPLVHYNLIIKLENFNNEFKKVMDILQLPGEPENYKWVEHATKASAKLSEYYTQECVELVLDIYGEDFEYFGYSKTPNFQLCPAVSAAKLSSHITPTIVQQCYQAFLLREPESETAINSKLAHTSFETLKQEFLSSPEYQQKLLDGDVLPVEYMKKISITNLRKIQQPRFMRLILDNYLLSKKHYGRCHELASLGTHGFCGLPQKDALKVQERVFQNFFDALLNQEKINKIPHKHYRTWITPPETPYECPEHIVQKYLNSLSSFDATAAWTHHFLCLDPAMIPNTVAMLESSPIPVQIHSLQDFISEAETSTVIQKLIQSKHYTFAKNLIAFEIVNRNGGIHFDMGFEIVKDYTPIIDSFDYLFYYHKLNGDKSASYPDITFFAAFPKSKLISRYLSIVRDFSTFPLSIRERFSRGENAMHILGIPLFLSLIASEINDDDKILYLNSSLYFNLERMDTWGRNCKFGNEDMHANTIEW